MCQLSFASTIHVCGNNGKLSLVCKKKENLLFDVLKHAFYYKP